MPAGDIEQATPVQAGEPVRLVKALASRVHLPDMLLLAVLAPTFTVWFLRIDDMPTDLMHYIPFASARFAEDGVFFHRFTPPFPDLWSSYSATGFTVWYTHYPPLPFYIGALLCELGLGAKAALAAFFDLVALGYVLLFYGVLSLVLNRWIACISTLALACHTVFIEQVLENYLNLSLFFQTAAFLSLVLALESDHRVKRRVLLLCAWAALFCDAFSSFDQTMASGFIVFAYTLWRLGRKQWKRVVAIVGLLATASIAAFVLHLATNAWFFGSFHAAFQDLCVNAFHDKSTGDIPFQSRITLREYPGWLAREVWDHYNMTLRGVAATGIALAWALLAGRKEPLTRKFFVIAGMMCVANLAYWVVFARLNLLQFHTANATQWLPTYSILLGGAVYFMAVEARRRWASSGIRKLTVLVPELLLLLCLLQLSLQALAIAGPDGPDAGAPLPEEMSSDAMLPLIDKLADAVPRGAVLVITDKSAFRQHMLRTPRAAFGLEEWPFTLAFMRASDENALFKLESLALSRDIYLLCKYPRMVSPEHHREGIIQSLAEAGVPREQWEEVIVDLNPIAARPDWDVVRSGENFALYRVHPPHVDDLFPGRASMPTRLAISGARVRDGHELQVIGWVYSPERLTRVEIRVDGESLGDAVYPAPGKELAARNMRGQRQWFGMHDYPLPVEEFEGNYPEYNDDTPRFVFLRRHTRLSEVSHTVSVHVYAGDTLVAEASYALVYANGTHRIREYFAVEEPPASPANLGRSHVTGSASPPS